jgi:hypothetical protein
MKIKFCKIQGVGYLIAKKDEDSNVFLTKIFNISSMLPDFFTLVFFFSIQAPYIKTCN